MWDDDTLLYVNNTQLAEIEYQKERVLSTPTPIRSKSCIVVTSLSNLHSHTTYILSHVKAFIQSNE